MADAVTSQTLVDNDRYAVMKFTNVSDGTGESAVTKVDVSALAPNTSTKRACNGVTIDKIFHDLSGMKVQIIWDADTDVLCFTLSDTASGDFDLSCFGGLVNNAGAGKTGDVKFTTVGHTSGDSYSVILFMRKSYA